MHALLGVRAQDVHRALGIVERVRVDEHGDCREVEAAHGEAAGKVTLQPPAEQLAGGSHGIGRVLAAHHVRAGDHQPLAGRIPGHTRSFDGDRPHRLVIALEVRSADEDELGEQHEPFLAVRVGQHLDDGPQHGDGVGDLAAECEPHGQVARRGDAQGWVGRLVRDAREYLPAVVFAGVPHRPAALEVDGVDKIRGRWLRHGALEQPHRGRQRAEPSRGICGTPQRSHDGGVAARRRAHEVLRDALVVQPPGGEQRRRACVQRGGFHRSDRLARRRRDDRVGEAVLARVEHALAAQLLLGGDRLGRLEPGQRARPRLVGVGSQHRDRARQ